jgi:hypothetical protein
MQTDRCEVLDLGNNNKLCDVGPKWNISAHACRVRNFEPTKNAGGASNRESKYTTYLIKSSMKQLLITQSAFELPVP